MNLVKKQIPIAIAFIAGIFMWWADYIPQYSVHKQYTMMLDWTIIIFGFALVIGVYSLLHHHANKIRRRSHQWGFSVVVYIAMFTMALAGLLHPKHMQSGSPLMWMFNNIQVPMQSTMFSILAFYIVSAAYRAFRARTKEATILLITGIIVMIGRVPIGEAMLGSTAGPYLTDFTEWILNTPNMAGQRGIMLGVGLAIIATSLRIIFGIERTYMGGGAD